MSFEMSKTKCDSKIIISNIIQNVLNEHQDNNKDNITKLYQRKVELTREFFELHNGYALIDNMFRQEVRNIQIYKKYWYLFMIQNTINVLKSLCCLKKNLPEHYYDQNQYFIPKTYRNPCHFGYVDKKGVYLLEKIMNYNRDGFI